jgi:hypothetical protein
VRQLAWLNAVPKPPEGSKRARAGAQAATRTRAEQMKRDGLRAEMPPNPAPHLIDRLIEIGLTEAAGMGAAPLSWREIDAWQRMTAVPLAPWEARLMRRLSNDYLAESRRAEDETCPPPWRSGPSKSEIASEDARLRMVLG